MPSEDPDHAQMLRLRVKRVTLRSVVLLGVQHLERVRPLVVEKAGDAPEDAKRLDRARRKGAAQIERFPTELIEDARHELLGGGGVAADEHGGAPGRVVGFTMRALPTELNAFTKRTVGCAF